MLRTAKGERYLQRAILRAVLLSLTLGPLLALPAVAQEEPGAPQAEPGAPQAEPPADPGEGPPSEKVKRLRRQRYAQAGGVDPCMTPDPGFGIYDGWSRAPTIGQMIAPQKGGLTRNGGFDLIVHFHGHHPIRKEFVKQAKGIVLLGIDLGIGSQPYADTFASPQAFTRLLASVEAEMARRSGRQKTYVRKLALSAWSAGYGAIGQILRQPAGQKVDAVILLDSVHTGYADRAHTQLRTPALEPFVQFAKQAAKGSRLMFQSYSAIIPPGYASTQEVAHHVIAELGGKPRPRKGNGVLGLQMFERYDRGGYHAQGYHGQDKPDHCAHLGLMTTVLKQHLEPRWRSPKGWRDPQAVSEDKQRARVGGRTHQVTSGQSLGLIARKYGTTVEALRAANGLRRGKPIQPGDELIIPESAKLPAEAEPQKAKRKPETKASDKPQTKRQKEKRPARKVLRLPPGAKRHVVAPGQSLRAIAKRYRITVDELRKANRMSPTESRLHPGDELIIPPSNAGKSKR